MRSGKLPMALGVDSPFFSTIVLLKNRLFLLGFDGLLKRSLPGKNGEGTPRMVFGTQLKALGEKHDAHNAHVRMRARERFESRLNGMQLQTPLGAWFCVCPTQNARMSLVLNNLNTLLGSYGKGERVPVPITFPSKPYIKHAHTQTNKHFKKHCTLEARPASCSLPSGPPLIAMKFLMGGRPQKRLVGPVSALVKKVALAAAAEVVTGELSRGSCPTGKVLHLEGHWAYKVKVGLQVRGFLLGFHNPFRNCPLSDTTSSISNQFVFYSKLCAY